MARSKTNSSSNYLRNNKFENSINKYDAEFGKLARQKTLNEIEGIKWP